jgi:hypothetical protein
VAPVEHQASVALEAFPVAPVEHQASVAFPVALEGRRASAAYLGEQVEPRRVALEAWAEGLVEPEGPRRAALVASVEGLVASVVSLRSSSIPQRRSSATWCWMHDEHITILHE